MRLARITAAAIAIPCLAGCKAQPVSEIVLAIQTDMSMPKDIDAIQIYVTDQGVVKFDDTYSNLGTGGPRLPATLGLLAPEDPTTPVDIIVDGQTDTDVRVLREIVTTVEAGKIVTLDMELHFLCNGFGMLDAMGRPKNTCDPGQTCIAGECKDNKVPGSTLDSYGTGSKVFGSGACFDGISCWSKPAVAMLDMTTCSLPPVKDVNIALQTEGIGICGPAGCFVTLDADSPEGWTTGKDGRIDLPPAVCTQIGEGKIVDVVTSPITSSCQAKNSSLPTCGPWSNAKQNTPPYTGPLALAGGQPRPTSLAVDTLGDLYWINSGLTGGTDGTVKTVAPTGGAPTAIAAMNQTPRDVLVTPVGVNSIPTAIWSSATPLSMGQPTGTIFTFAAGASTFAQAYTGLVTPEGVAVNAGNLFWTDFTTKTIFMGSIDGTAQMTSLVTNANYPYRIVADDTYVYWTDEGTTGMVPADGAIESFDYATMTPGDAMTMISTPRAIALEPGPTGTAAVWYATFEAQGSLVRVPVMAGAFGAKSVMATGLGFPNGIAIDGKNVYWTNRSDGTLQMLPLSDTPGPSPDTIVKDQLAPGNIAVDDKYVYWVNEGSSTDPSGGVLKLPKP